MDAIEIQGLSDWYKAYFKGIRQRFDALLNVLSTNASQQVQQPVEEPLTNLVDFLKEIRLQELSLEQLRLLEQMEVLELFGPAGAENVSQIVRTASYDPASVDQKIRVRLERVNSAQEKLTNVSSALKNLGFSPESFDAPEDRITIRVGFKRDASIDNIKDWKSSAEDWYQIVRGVGLAVGEAPEDTKILGATKGSVILILGATCAVTGLLAVISRNICGIAKDTLSVLSEIENLRQKKMLTATMETEMKKLVDAKREEGLKAIEHEVEQMMSATLDGEKQTALQKSIHKLLDFGEKGGDIDFVEPPEAPSDGPEEASDVDQLADKFSDVRRFIQEYQELREQLKQIEHKQ